MRKPFLIGLMAVLCGGSLLAQPTPRPGTQPVVPATKATPSDRTDKAAKMKGSAMDQGRPAPVLSPAASDVVPRSTTTTTAGDRAAGDAVPRSTQPKRPNATARNASTTTTSKTPPSAAQAAPALKTEEVVQIQWMSLEEALERNKTEKRKIFIDVYTVWCKWCKHMDQTTFTNRSIARYVNSHYYAVRFDAEQQQDIVFRDKTYRFKRNGARGYHELAAEWLNNRLSYPTVVFLDEDLNVIQPLSGYLESVKLEAILNYFGTNSHKTTPWETYERKFSQR